jgi:hypothetical protein
MIFFAHLIIGYWLYLKFGYWQVIPLSLIFDVDHLIGFFIRKMNKSKSPISDMQTLFTHPRSWLHSITGFLIFFVPSLFFMPWYVAALPLILHLIVDFDKDGFAILPPITKKRIYGSLPIVFNWRRQKKKKIDLLGYVPSVIFIAVMALLIYFRIGL